jgi:glycosidase
VQELASALSEMGITAMWIPRARFRRVSAIRAAPDARPQRRRRPPTKCAIASARTAAAHRSAQDSVGYDIYDVYDLGEFPAKAGMATKYGTKDQLRAAVAAAHEHGIVTYVDAVLNHKFGADEAERFAAREVDTEDRTQYTTDTYEIEVRCGGEPMRRGR